MDDCVYLGCADVRQWQRLHLAPMVRRAKRIGSPPTDSGNRPQLVWDTQWRTGRPPHLPRGEQCGVEGVEDLEITGERAQYRHSGAIEQLFRDLVPHERLRQLRDALGLPTLREHFI